MGQTSVPPVIVGVDGSSDGLRAVRYAARTADAVGCDLRILHAVDDAVLAGAWGVIYDPTVLEEAGRHAVAQAEEAAAESLPSERIHGEVVLGNPASVMIRESETARLAVVGRRAVSGLERIFVGSTSVAVAAHAQCPVVMISHDTNPGPTGGFSRIGVGMDGDMRSTPALEWACREAEARGAEVHVVHVVQPPPSGLFGEARIGAEEQDRLMALADEQLRKAVEEGSARWPGVPFSHRVEFGNPVDELVGASHRLDLLIMGTQRSGFPGMALGGLVRGVMAHSVCPVGVCRHQG